MSAPDYWRSQPVIPVVVINDSANAVQLARTLVDAGLLKIEITLRTEAALKSIELIAKGFPYRLNRFPNGHEEAFDALPIGNHQGCRNGYSADNSTNRVTHHGNR